MQFNIDKWMNYCELYQKNKKGLGFNALCNISGGKLNLQFNNLEKKYEKTVYNLGVSICQGMINFMYGSINPISYAADADVSSEIRKCQDMIKEFTEKILCLLLQEGYKSAISFFYTKMGLIRIKYESDHFHYENGNWINAKGEIFEDGFFTDPKTGYTYSDMFSPFWTSVINSNT